MPIVDNEGRLFGRWNFVDAAIAVLVIGLIPVGYAAYLLFRTPAPRLTGIEPAEVVQGPDRRVTIKGVNLRPYLRVSFNTLQGRTFLFQDVTTAQVDLNEMPAGLYDVVLYDFGQEKYRLRNAFTITPKVNAMPTQTVTVSARLINVAPGDVAAIKKGVTLPFVGTIQDVAEARRSAPRVFFGGLPFDVAAPKEQEIPVTIALPCSLKVTDGYPECGTPQFTLRPKYVVSTSADGKPLTLQIDQLLGVDPVVMLQVPVRFTGTAEAIANLKVGDLDVEQANNPYSLGARIAALSSRGAGEAVATLAVRAQRLRDGWWTGAVTLRIGAQIPFVTDRYSLAASVLDIRDAQH